MDYLLVLIAAIIALVVGLVAGWAARAARAATETSALRARAAGAESLVAGLREQLGQQRADDAERLERERRDQAVLQALAPVRDTLQTMQRQIGEWERERGHQYGTIASQLRLSRETDEQLRSATEALAGALRSNSTRGVWGETQLRRVVEASGLTRHVDFDLQRSVTTHEGTGRPDMVVRLPGGAAIAVDAKAPLDRYLEASAAADESIVDAVGRREDLLRRHARDVRGHVDALAKRAYWEGIEGSPEFVICFIPSEAILAAALDADPTLLDHAFAKRVALASPVNLWAVLKTVSFTWTQQAVSEEAKQLFDLGNTLYQRLSTLTGHAESLRRAIERTVVSYNRFAGALESRVLVTARQFPGIDESRLLESPETLEELPRTLTAPEFADGEATAVSADVGPLRDRL